MRRRGVSILIFLIPAVVVFILIKASFACSVCFGGAADDPSNKALRDGVLLLMVVVIVVLALFAKFFLNIRKRTREILSRR